MEDQRQIEREEDSKTDQEPFRTIALWLIDTMLDLNNKVQQEAQRDANILLDEILHSIFFLGKICNPSVSPESILSDDDMLNELKCDYPRPFELYSSQLPTRSPFSCVLDMIVLLLGRQNETDIIDGLRNLIKELIEEELELDESRDLQLGGSRDLVSSTICVSHRTDNKDQVKYYGVSISAPGRYPRRFMIAASCLSNWDEYVAGAVMTYFPKKIKKPYFDGTIKLPEDVRCQAFDLLGENVKPPCRSCANMFGLETVAEKASVYGNCAEAESLSNLFKNDDVRDEAPPTSTKYSVKKRNSVEKQVRAELKNLLNVKGKFTWRGDFYSPQ